MTFETENGTKISIEKVCGYIGLSFGWSGTIVSIDDAERLVSALHTEIELAKLEASRDGD